MTAGALRSQRSVLGENHAVINLVINKLNY